MILFDNIFHNRNILITGHTGFKGSWLTLWLYQLGAKVTGLSLAAETNPNHWDQLKIPIHHQLGDIRDTLKIKHLIDTAKPEIIFHLAAQSLVRRSYQNPGETWSTNVMGTVNLLEACRNQPSIRAIIVITTDKCYENQEWPWGYRENDRLGGHDPYSASKAGTELVVASYRNAFFHQNKGPLLATARAGNVIGGGDWSQDRLIPDLVRALEKKQSLEIRSPLATRPWQHVLDCLYGYLLLSQKLMSGDTASAQAWNFGPEVDSNQPVAEVLKRLKHYWPDLNWHQANNPQPHETTLLYLDSTQAKCILGWKPIWNIDQSLEKTAEWYQTWLETGLTMSHSQLKAYTSALAKAKTP